MSRERHRASGGKISTDSTAGAKVYAGGDSNVLKEAEKRRRGGRVHRGKRPMHVEGGEPRHHRLDRPGRKRGGAVGADSSPMTEASRLTMPGAGNPKDDE